VKIGQTFVDDATLVAQLQRGDLDALSALYLRHKDPLYTYCLRFGISDAACRDIVQDTFLRVHERVETLQDGMAFRPWILTIARHMIFNRERDQHLVFGEMPDVESEEEGPLGTVVRLDESGRIWSCIDALDPLSREMLQLRVEQELSYRDIAAMTGVTEEAVRTRLYRTRKALIEQLYRKEGKKP
jgi:RNA polymerase sigma factor (sigma-70 family)